MDVWPHICELVHDCDQLTHGLEAELNHVVNQHLPLAFINLELLRDDALDELDLVDENLVLFLQPGEHVGATSFVQG